jgi:diguanylate cyclase (GGDEF)-like protein
MCAQTKVRTGMIYAYTVIDENGRAVQGAAQQSASEVEFRSVIDRAGLSQHFEADDVLIFDLTEGIDPAPVFALLDSVNAEELPPILYLVTDPAGVEKIGHVENALIQDYTFAPITTENIAARLKVLTLLGARRRRALESAVIDKLTELYNRKYFLRRLEEELYRGARYGYTVGILLADVDFETERESVKEHAGVAAIVKISQFLRGRLRKSDIVARYSWSEFAILLPDIPAEDIAAVASDLKQKIEALRVTVDDTDVRLRASVGYVKFPATGLSTALELVAAVEESCFLAKAEGSEGVVGHSDAADGTS